VPACETSSWFGPGGLPRNTPAEIIDKLKKKIKALADAKMKARLTELGGTALPLSPAEFAKLIADETDKWGKVIRAANIKAE
jgi:tripartite-type tricarboxylate transporter receptor subunit TctC